MTPRDVFAALAASVIWGLTFIAIKFGVEQASPFLLTSLRFLFAAVPAIFFIKPPKTSPVLVALYGLMIGVCQFGLIFLAIKLGMPIGLVALVVQLQAFITILLTWAFLGERPTVVQAIAAGIALLGILTIGSARLEGAELLPFLLTLGGAAFWGAGNVVGKYAGRVDPLGLIVWSSLVPPLPMLALSLLTEGGETLQALTHPTLILVVCVAVLAYGGTLIAFSLWSGLLSRYPAAAVTPFALLIPVVGMIGGRVVFNEPTTPIELFGSALIMAGLSFNIFGERLFAIRRWRAG
jgi:O-acetylserine/cysteine efflux transporter